MPTEGDGARAAQLSTLQGLYHERLIDPRVGEWLDQAAIDASLTQDHKRQLHLLAKERSREVRVPSRLVRELASAQSRALSAWRRARDEQRFEAFRPELDTLVALRREQADAWGYGEGERYDALLEHYEPGMRVARLSPVLESLAKKLAPIVEALAGRPAPKDVFAGKSFDAEAQWRFTVELLPRLGFNLKRGRQDRSIHPFTSGGHPTDVRLTTRITEATPLPAIFGTIHEVGHGLYEQGFDVDDARTPLAQAPSMGLHESQSRLWENLVGRGQAFWRFAWPSLQAAFPAQLGAASLQDFYGSVNTVRRSLNRVESDEVTYNLHIALRYELELGLVRGTLSPKDLEAAWNERTKALLGLEVLSPKEGVLQDIHWAWGEFGYFPTYTLGNLYASSLFEAARRELDDLEGAIERGELSLLLDWLRQRVHRHGFRLDAEQLIEQVTGQGLTDADFLAHVKAKYGALYGVALG